MSQARVSLRPRFRSVPPSSHSGCFSGEPGALCHAFGLEPDERLHPAAQGVVADRPQPAREPLQVGLPGACLGPLAAAGIPAGVHPPVRDGNSLLEVAIDELDLVRLVGVAHLVELARGVAEEDGGGELAVAGPRDVVGEHPAAPEVLGPNQILALPEDERDQRRANLLPGPEHQVRELLARRDPQRPPGVTGERRGPLARPSHRDHQPAVGRHEVVVRELAIAPASPGRSEPRDGAGAEGPLERLVEIGGEGVALPVMKHELPF